MKLQPVIQRELDLIPGRWRLEMGTKHLKVIVDGRMAAILPRDGWGHEQGKKGGLNIRAQIRRAAAGRTG